MVAIINETAARTLFPDRPALGQRLGFSLEKAAEIEVIGVIRDTKYSSVRHAAPPTIYQPFQQGAPRGMTPMVRTAGPPAALRQE
jgi:hypothetical protein